jgi:hypothetical protein
MGALRCERIDPLRIATAESLMKLTRSGWWKIFTRSIRQSEFRSRAEAVFLDGLLDATEVPEAAVK